MRAVVLHSRIERLIQKEKWDKNPNYNTNGVTNFKN